MFDTIQESYKPMLSMTMAFLNKLKNLGYRKIIKCTYLPT